MKFNNLRCLRLTKLKQAHIYGEENIKFVSKFEKFLKYLYDLNSMNEIILNNLMISSRECSYLLQCMDRYFENKQEMKLIMNGFVDISYHGNDDVIEKFNQLMGYVATWKTLRKISRYNVNVFFKDNYQSIDFEYITSNLVHNSVKGISLSVVNNGFILKAIRL